MRKVFRYFVIFLWVLTVVAFTTPAAADGNIIEPPVPYDYGLN